MELWCPIKIRELVRQVIFFESKGFHVGNVVSADFFRVDGFRNVSVTTCFARPQTKLFANDLQVVTLTDHNNDVINCFIYLLVQTYISLGVLLNVLSPNSAQEFRFAHFFFDCYQFKLEHVQCFSK